MGNFENIDTIVLVGMGLIGGSILKGIKESSYQGYVYGLDKESKVMEYAFDEGLIKNKVKVIIFAEDVAASGGYLISCAGDEIFANSSSIIGSIGVISASFGFKDLIQKIGVERRVYTAGIVSYTHLTLPTKRIV